MTAEEIRNAMNESMKKIVNTENIINFHMDLIQKAFLEALSLGMKIGEANAEDNKWHFVKNGDLPEDFKDVLICDIHKNCMVGQRNSTAEENYVWEVTEDFMPDKEVIAWKKIEPPEIEEE